MMQFIDFFFSFFKPLLSFLGPVIACLADVRLHRDRWCLGAIEPLDGRVNMELFELYL